jgi:hypothetical protein
MVLVAALAVVAGLSGIGARQPQLDIDSAGSLAPLVLNLLVHQTEYSNAGDVDPSAPVACPRSITTSRRMRAGPLRSSAMSANRSVARHCLVLAQ